MRDPIPLSPMLAELGRRLTASPFLPFTIVMSSGERLEVPTPDHLTITRRFHEVIWESDGWRSVTVNPLHVVALEYLKPAA